MQHIGIFIDLDGTLTNSKKTISSYDKEIIAKVISLGHKVYLNTGKSIINSIEYYDELNLDTILISSMGQVLSKPHDETFAPIITPVKFEICQALFNEVDKTFGIRNFLVETLDEQYYVQNDVQSNLINIITEGRHPKEYKHEHLDNIIGSYAEVNDHTREDLLEKTEMLNNKWDGKFEFAFWITDGNLPIIQIKPKHTGKSIAMKRVMGIDHIDYSIAFGNGWSDRHMIEEANEGYAMLNSASTVKAYAKYVTQFDNNDSGVGRELARIFNL